MILDQWPVVHLMVVEAYDFHFPVKGSILFDFLVFTAEWQFFLSFSISIFQYFNNI